MNISRKNFLFFATSVLVIYLAIETISYLGFWIGNKKKFSFEEITRAKAGHVALMESLRTNSPTPEAASFLAPHPYIGFVYHPAYHPEKTKASAGVPVSEWGFLDDKTPLHEKSDDKVVIGIFGGSVAFWLSVKGIDPMLAELAKVPEFNGKRFIVVRTALGGFKQPQQLMTVNYLLALGGHFDIILNLDGLNDVALAPAWIRKNGMFPHFPREWGNLVSRGADFEMLRRLGELNVYKVWRGEWASLFLRPGLRHSVTLNTIWNLTDRIWENRIARAQYRIDAYTSSAANKAVPYGGRGPAREYENTESMYADLALVWQRSSWQMHTLAQGKNIRYYHVLQPNQYFKGSKKLGEAERKVAIHEGSIFERGVNHGYPLLIRGGSELRERGVKFFDLTMIFQNTTEPVYIDNCCHLNLPGNQVLGRRIGELIRADIANRQ